MAKIAQSTKTARLDRILLLLKRAPNGLKEQEIAKELGLERRAVNNYLRELEAKGYIYKDDICWHLVPYQPATPRQLHLEPEQAIVLYLAMRLFVKQSDRRVETAETLLYELANILNEDLNLSQDIVQVAKMLSYRPHSPDHEDVLKKVAQAYIYRRQIKILYQPYRGEPFETILSPYLIEPASLGFATYVIGLSSIVGAMRTYKIERIQRAHILFHHEYAIPDDFPGLDLLTNAWSIYYGEQTTRVVLRFHPDVTRRVLETNWRTSTDTSWDETHPGYLRLTFEVADTTDLKPWIRTWGANCEVLEPPELRDEMTGEARKLARLYGWELSLSQSGKPDHRKFRDIFGA
ncbi:MAG: WYL domain-containing protein [Chloroflexi bacterium]|nr:WYL domain-containing protein [Chloroflexota bacterium]